MTRGCAVLTVLYHAMYTANGGDGIGVEGLWMEDIGGHALETDLALRRAQGTVGCK